MSVLFTTTCYTMGEYDAQDTAVRIFDLAHAWASSLEEGVNPGEEDNQIVLGEGITYQNLSATLLDSVAFALPNREWTSKLDEIGDEIAKHLTTKEAASKKGRKRRRRKRPSKANRSRLSTKAQLKRLESYRLPFRNCLFVLSDPLPFKTDFKDLLEGYEDNNTYPPGIIEIQDDFRVLAQCGFIARSDQSSISMWTGHRKGEKNSWRLMFFEHTQRDVEIGAALKVVGSTGTYALTAKPPGPERDVGSWESEAPDEYYKVYLRSGFVSDVSRGREEPLDLDRAYRWRVRGHWRMYVRRGPKPIEEWEALEYDRKGFHVWTDEVDDETHREELRKRGKRGPSDTEWVATKLQWIEEQVRGPSDMPLVESVRVKR